MQTKTEDLVAAARASDERAREELFSRAARLAYARAYRLLRDPDAADDAAQEALVSAYLALGDLRDPKSFVGWLRRIVDRAVAKRNCAPRPDVPLRDPPQVGPEPTPHDILERREAEAAVARAVALLPPRSRLVVELFYFDGLTCPEVAEFLQVSTDSVKATLHRSRERMRRSVGTMAAPPGRTRWRQDMPLFSLCMGDKAFSDRWWGYDPDAMPIYWGVYPKGSPGEAAQAEGIDAARVDLLVGELEARLLVERRDGILTCTAPIFDDLDREVLRPWLDRATAPVIAAIDELADQAEQLAASMPTEAGCQSAGTVAILSGLLSQVFQPANDSLEDHLLDAGELGRYLFAWVMGDGGPPTVDAVCHVRRMTTPLGELTRVAAQPSGWDRSAIGAFVSSHPSADNGAGWPKPALWAFVTSLEMDAVARAELPERLTRCELDGADDGLADGLVSLGWAEWEGERLRSRIPVGPAEQWAPFWERLDRIGSQVAEDLRSADLERRVSRCSFAECYPPNVHLGCQLLMSQAVSREIHRRGLAAIPDQPDPAWGCLLLHSAEYGGRPE